MHDDAARGPAGSLGKDAAVLAGLFLVSGVLHFARPQVFEPIVPKSLPSRRGLVYASGAAEVACATGLLVPRTRRAAGLASAALLVAVFPANVTMTAQAVRRLNRNPADPRRRAYLAATVARLPLQWPMVRAGLRAGGVLR
ncbi:DoxX family protein [Intrasporangium calvum]|uniref:DoxX family protein n=1 Tax=Intrasporangium calvum TaxID=53358 RepID=UPI000DF60AFD|nr:MauE/DoxX family redox-associated membrane protein [Intrasporangium calvum]AXG13734.1 DoxX family protein [Intrasporangium calvum]